ncbi:hypothetical protein HWV62_333 [Athelia sp. TMB]|nr:hypothetical protein HWV62_333 [Athelia sp. TMB]
MNCIHQGVSVDRTSLGTTAAAKKTLRPTWAEDFAITSSQESSVLVIELIRESFFKNTCLGIVNVTVGQLLHQCEGGKLTQVKLGHGSKNAPSDADGSLSIRVVAASTTQVMELTRRKGQKAIQRLQPKNSDAGRETATSAPQVLTDHTPTGTSTGGRSASTLGPPQELRKHHHAESAGSATLANLETRPGTNSNGTRESAVPASALELPALESSTRPPQVDPADHHPGAAVAAFSSVVDNLGAEIYQNMDVVNSLGTVLNKIQLIADVTEKVADELTKAYKQQKLSDSNVISLFEKIKDLYSFVDDIQSLPGVIRRLEDKIMHVLEQTTKCGKFFQEYTKNGFVVRLVGQPLSDHNTKIATWSSIMEQLREDLREGLQLHTAVTSSRLVKSDNLEKLVRAKMVAGDRRTCLSGTRQDVLKDVFERLMAPSDKNIIWLHGAAGLGKSTIATSAAEHFAELQKRGAFLFFDRNLPIESDPSRVISTLAYQLAMHNGVVGSAISAAIDRDALLCDAATTLTSQFTSLLSKPLSEASAEIEEPIIVVLDALDECGNAASRRTLLRILSSAEFAKLPRQFRFLITSRPDPDIQNSLASCSHVQPVDLAKASDPELQLYFTSELQAIYKERHATAYLPAGWPDLVVINTLVRLAAGLFIWAATAMRHLYITGRPARWLEDLVKARATCTLHDLYKTALLSAWDTDLADAGKRILWLIVVSQVPPTDETITKLLGFTDRGEQCKMFLHRLRCVVQWSEGQPALTLHKSFPDYLTDRSACASEPWFIDEAEHQGALTLACLRIMNTQLHFNMCNLKSSHIPNSSIKDLPNQVAVAIPQYILYPCRFWGHHLSHIPSDEPSILSIISRFLDQLCGYHILQTPFEEPILPLILEFLESKFLYWLEVLSLVGEVQAASQTMLTVKTFVPNDDTGLQALAQDALKFVRVFAPAIAYSTPHIYVSCVPFAPPLSVIKRQYIPSLERTLVISGDAQYGWPALQQVYKGHTSRVRSAAFSSDGRRIASGSDDGSIHIWDAETGLLAVGPIQGDVGWIFSVAFSPDGRTVASGSMDGTVCIWDAETGVLAAGPFKGHTGIVHSVAFSPDGLRLASGSADRTVRVWNTETGVLAAGPFVGHTDKVNSVAFAPDGRKVASGSDDRTVRIWNVETGSHVTIEGHTSMVYSVVFSPDGLHVVSGSEDKTVYIWNAETGTLTAGPFKGHTDSVRSVAYSPDGLRVASGSDDQTIRIWSLQSGTITQTFKGHTSMVYSVAFSSDGQRIASASRDSTVRIWDAEAGPLAARTSELSKGHTKDINSVVFSPDGRHIASGSDDCTMCIWGAETGKLTGGPYEGHTGAVYSVSFSPDGRRVATGSGDHTIRLWDVEMGSHVTLTGHSDIVLSVTFSPDGRNVVSGSGDKTICMWDSETGVLIAGPVEGHEDPVRSVVFSPDGRQVASGSHDTTVRVWAVDTSVLEARKFEGHTGEVFSIAFSPDGRKIASGSDDKTVRIWDIETGSHVAIQGHTGRVWSVAFSPDGRHIASGSGDRTVRIWNVATGALIAGPFREHGTLFSSVAFSPDGRRLAFSGKFAIRVFDVGALHKQEAILSLCSREQADDGNKASEGFTRLSQLQEDGWIVNPGGDLLFYVPPDLREGLCWPHGTAVINKQMTHLDVSQFAHGLDWAQCHIAQ